MDKLMEYELTFITRAIQLTQEISKLKTVDEMRTKVGQLEGYLTGVREIFQVTKEIIK